MSSKLQFPSISSQKTSSLRTNVHCLILTINVSTKRTALFAVQTQSIESRIISEYFWGVSNTEEIGIVSFFHVRRGFGRIRTDSNPEGVFVHFSAVEEEAQILIPNELVRFRIVEGEKGPVAAAVRRISRREQGVVSSANSGKGIICSDTGEEFAFTHKDLLADTATFNRVISGWKVQFSPLQEGGKSLAKEIVICDTRSPLLQLAKIDKWKNKLRMLASIAEPEEWSETGNAGSYSILENYILETFRILNQEDGVTIIPKKGGQKIGLWNTGLLTHHGEEIIVRMDSLSQPPKEEGYLSPAIWKLTGFFPLSDRRIPTPDEKLPIALEFVEYQALIPNPSASLIPDLDHLMKRNQRLPGFWSQLPRSEQIQRLQGALHKLGLMLKRNPRMAIPQWYEEAVQYLVPLDLGDGRGPIGALVLEQKGLQLRVQTVLQLEWAYQNARLLGPMRDNWLSRWKAGGIRPKAALKKAYSGHA